ncbi:hypothetical protein [Rubidibacter lacunae]|nr:hypothetical protein [Rubidibacter lacunae]
MTRSAIDGIVIKMLLQFEQLQARGPAARLRRSVVQRSRNCH